MSVALAHAQSVLGTVSIAIESGAWTVDGACDPDALIDSLARAVAARDNAGASRFTASLSDVALNAIDRGDWINADPANLQLLRKMAPQDEFSSADLAA